MCVCYQENKQRFLKTFIPYLKNNAKASEAKILNMMNEVNKNTRVKIKRSAGERYHRNIITLKFTYLPSRKNTAETAGFQEQHYNHTTLLTDVLIFLKLHWCVFL